MDPAEIAARLTLAVIDSLASMLLVVLFVTGPLMVTVEAVARIRR